MTVRDQPVGRAPVALGILLGTLLVGSFGLVAFGLYLPAITIQSFYVFTEEYSILSGIISLFDQGQPILGSFVLAVSVVFPLLKITLGLIGIFTLESYPVVTRRTIQTLSALSKWSMVDVFAIALAVIVINGRILSTADIQIGVGLFAGGVLLSTVAIHGLERLTARAG